MSIEIVPYDKSHEEGWDGLCHEATSATFLHTRRFLGYHLDRFKDGSALIVEKGEVLGVFPAAESRSDGGIVVSHPGVTYGYRVEVAGKSVVYVSDNEVQFLKTSIAKRIHEF